MELKTYRGRSLADALAEVRRDLGNDAVVVRTRTVPAGGGINAILPGNLTGRSVVEIEAHPAAEPEPAPVRVPSAETSVPESTSARNDGFQELVWPGAAPEPAVGRGGPGDGTQVSPVQMDGLSEEVRSLRGMMAELLERSRPRPLEVNAPVEAVAFTELRTTLIAAGVEPEIAQLVVDRTRTSLHAAAVLDGPTVRRAAAGVLAGTLRTVHRELWSSGLVASGPCVVAFIGPTGVGKTTTIAKVAASLKLKLGRRVALITSDTYRIAAVEQLRTYAEIIGLPLRVVMTPQEMQAARAGLGGFDVVLVDTAGRSPKDSERLDELTQHLDAITPDITLLTLALNADPRALERSVQQFAGVSPNGVVYTKLDEAVAAGAILNLSHRHGLPTSLVTTGQEVPDDMDLPTPDRLAAMVLHGPGSGTNLLSTAGSAELGGLT